ncbi:DUF6266 family protein [Pedobacter deserti]|uniref:DUF6266 family protein n=1 Tax=Pedobacter deserti TaxID=2817382 RepID=UPI00210DA79D|nr:DUF6266 family protein [Pedobacter sp. SYSU D00382]
MAKYKQGINGAFSGKVGTVVGASWLGIEYMRSLPRPSSKPPTPEQLNQRQKMTLFRKFLLGLDDFIALGFQNFEQATPMNAAISYNMLHAVAGTYPEQRIDFPNLVFTKGDLQGAWSATATSETPNTVDFGWTNGSFSKLRAAGDKAQLVTYCPEKRLFVKLRDAAQREDGQARLIMPNGLSGLTVHCYLSFFSADGKLSSASEYLGEVTVA